MKYSTTRTNKPKDVNQKVFEVLKKNDHTGVFEDTITVTESSLWLTIKKYNERFSAICYITAYRLCPQGQWRDATLADYYNDFYTPHTAAQLESLETNVLKDILISLVSVADDIHFEPLDNKHSSGNVPHTIISDINRITVELTSRYLCSGF